MLKEELKEGLNEEMTDEFKEDCACMKENYFSQYYIINSDFTFEKPKFSILCSLDIPIKHIHRQINYYVFNTYIFNIKYR